MKTIYKTAGEIQRDKKHKQDKFWAYVGIVFCLLTVVVLMIDNINNSMRDKSEIKALKAQIQACEAKPACKRELEK